MTHFSQDAEQQCALREPEEDTLARWAQESADLDKQGVYDWLCQRVRATRVLEIGCGFGVSTEALSRNGKSVFALDNRMDCLQATQLRVPAARYGLVDLHQIPEQLIQDLQAFEPQAMVVWIAGAVANALPRQVPVQHAVMQYRLAFQQAAVALATHIQSIATIHFADKTAFPWAMKDAGRQTLSQLLQTIVLANTPFSVQVCDVSYRKLTLPIQKSGQSRLPGGIVPVVGAASCHRIQN